MIWNFNDFGNDTAVILENGDRISYSDLLESSKELSTYIPERCLSFNLCTNTAGSLLGYVTFLNHEVVPFMIEAGSEERMVLSLIEIYKPDFLWCPSNIKNKYSECVEVYTVWGYSLLKTTNNKVFDLHKDLALLLTTSGSTGSPKLVRQSYENIKANTKSITEYLKLDKTEKPITTLPMSYTYGLSIINTHLYVGATVIITEKTMMQREFWHQFKVFAATSFGGVPYNYEMLDKLRFFRMELPSLRTMTQAGGKLSPELHKKFAEYAIETGRRFVVMYGQTEATARMSYLPPENALSKFGSMGIAIPGGRFSLIDTDRNEIVDTDTVGELVYYGNNVTLGYAESGADLAKGDDWNGVLVTGDMAKRDVDGYYYIVGRKKRFLKIYGNRVNLDEIESMLKKEFPDIDCACGGKDDRLFVFLTNQEHIDDIKKILFRSVKLNPSAYFFKVISEMPRNDSGKILYKDFEQFYDF